MILKAPLSEEEVRSLRVGQQVSVDGTVFIGRDEVHMRALELHGQGKLLPVDLEDGILYHCGPIVKRDSKGWKVIAAGPTTSARMNALEPEGVRDQGHNRKGRHVPSHGRGDEGTWLRVPCVHRWRGRPGGPGHKQGQGRGMARPRDARGVMDRGGQRPGPLDRRHRRSWQLPI